MWIKTYTQEYNGIKKEDVWQIWKDVNNYTTWHRSLDSCMLEGEFKVGNFFRLKPKGAPAVKVFLTEIVENKRFVDCTNFLGAKMYDTHEILETASGIKITNTVTVIGFLSFLWIKLVAQGVASSAPQEMDAVVELAKRKYG